MPILFRLAQLAPIIALGLFALSSCAPASRSSEKAEPGQEQRVIGETYPLVLYGVPNLDEDFRRTKELGFNHVYMSGNGFAGDPADAERMADIQAYLDRATAHGLKVAFCLDGHRRLRRGELGIEQMQKIVQRFKDHPAVGFWYLYDEPNLPSAKTKKAMLAARLQEEGNRSEEAIVKEVVTPPERLLPAYEMVKREAPDIPVIVMMAITHDGWWQDSWEQFYDTYDIVSFDTYPVYAAPFPQSPLDRVTSWMERYTQRTDKPVMPCLQTFNWKTLSGRVERAKAAGNTETDNWRYPSLEELRYWNFSSLIQGAPGAIYYTYGGPDANRRPPAEWLDKDLKTTTHELRRFTALTRLQPFKRLAPTGENPILCAAWQTPEGRFLVVANGSATKQQVTEKEILAELKHGKVDAWDFTRKTALDLKEGKVAAINLEPWEVLIWQIQ